MHVKPIFIYYKNASSDLHVLELLIKSPIK